MRRAKKQAGDGDAVAAEVKVELTALVGQTDDAKMALPVENADNDEAAAPVEQTRNEETAAPACEKDNGDKTAPRAALADDAQNACTPLSMPPAYVYMVECADGTLYTGWTTDVARRVEAHNAGHGAKYTRSRRPVCLRYSEQCPDKCAALRRERAIKQLTRAQKQQLMDKGR